MSARFVRQTREAALHINFQMSTGLRAIYQHNGSAIASPMKVIPWVDVTKLSPQ
jgi:hypothetical protein